MDELNRFRQQLIDDHIFPNSQSGQYNFEFQNSFLHNNNNQDVISHRNADERISNLMGDQLFFLKLNQSNMGGGNRNPSSNLGSMQGSFNESVYAQKQRHSQASNFSMMDLTPRFNSQQMRPIVPPVVTES